MIRRRIACSVMILSCSMSVGAAHAQAASQKASVDHSDVMLFQQAQHAMRQSNYAAARSLLATLIDTHPNSHYVPLAKFSISDSWYSEHAFRQAELEYQDFVTFFPHRREVAEAQRRINSIHKESGF